MDDATLYFLFVLIGQLVTPLNDIINKRIKSANYRYLSNLLVCIGIGVLFNSNRLTWGNWEQIITSMTVLFASSQTAYQLWYQDSKYQSQIRYNQSNFPLKQLVPPLPTLKK